MRDANRTQPGRLDSLKNDLMASVVVFLVALPLCMGIAIASGVPTNKAAAVGIISGIVGGVVVGLLAGSPLQATGPAAGLAVIVGQLIAQHGYETLGPILMVAGAVQLLAGFVGIGQWFRAVSPAVIQGMLAGIGVLIFAGQFHVMVDDQPPGSGKEFGGVINLVTIPTAVWKGLTEQEHKPAAFLGVLTILAIVSWAALPWKKLKLFPAPLFGVLMAMAVAGMARFDVNYITVPDSLADAITWPTPASWGQLLNLSIVGAGLVVAFVASAESLLTATAADAMQQHAPRTKYGRELVAQGTGNVVCGLLGVLPLTGVIVRTSANIQAGARTRNAAMLHGVWLLVFAVLFPAALRLIPVASLAAILVYTGWKLTNPKAAKALRAYGRSEVAIYAATLGGVVGLDLLTGIVIGLGLALAKLVYTFTHLELQLEPLNGRTTLSLRGAATFLRLPKLAQALEKVAPNTELHVHFEALSYIDHACLDLLMKWEKQHAATGGTLEIDWEGLHARFRRNGGQEPLAKPTSAPSSAAAFPVESTRRSNDKSSISRTSASPTA